MKSLALPTPVLLLIVLLVSCGRSESPQVASSDSTAVIDGPELLERTIAYHDPAGSWATFSGSVRILTAFPDGSSALEIIQVDKPAGLYRGMRFLGNVRAERGVRNGSCYRSLNGDENPPQEEVERYNLGCESALVFNEHHPAHIGFPMEARTAGVEVEEAVARAELEGRPALALVLVGDSTTVRHPYWMGRRTLYVHPDSYALLGYLLEDYPGQPDALWLFSGELDVNGIKMPLVKRVFRPEDDSMVFTDVFTHPREWELDQL